MAQLAPPSICTGPEVGSQASWTATSAKAGNGVELLRDGRADTYWQWVARFKLMRSLCIDWAHSACHLAALQVRWAAAPFDQHSVQPAHAALSAGDGVGVGTCTSAFTVPHFQQRPNLTDIHSPSLFGGKKQHVYQKQRAPESEDSVPSPEREHACPLSWRVVSVTARRHFA